MPSIPHEAPLELLRRNPALAALLLASQGIEVPSRLTASLTASDVGTSVPTELRADAVIVFSGDDGPRLAVVIEVQLRFDPAKTYSWPPYLAQVRSAHRCPAVLLVICVDAATARRCREPIRTGHPGFDLVPLVSDGASTPGPARINDAAPVELAVLAVLTGALDLENDAARRFILTRLASLDADRQRDYTVFVLNAASESARKELENLMTTTEFRNSFIDRIEARGRRAGEARGKAQMILRVLAARGLRVSREVRQRVLTCTDESQLAVWGDRAATASSVDEVFGA